MATPRDPEYGAVGTCPRCKSELPLRALSRVDNKTYICDPCGTQEALWDVYFPDKPLAPVNEPVVYI